MNLDFIQQIPGDFHPQSKVWIYQSNRIFSIDESVEIDATLQNFASSWKSHGATVKGFGKLFFGAFIVLIADETHAGVSGCSTDSSVRIIKEMEKKYAVELFNRQILAFEVNDHLQFIPLNQIQNAIADNIISGETIYFNNPVLTKQELEENWIIQLKNSWLGNKINVVLDSK